MMMMMMMTMAQSSGLYIGSCSKLDASRARYIMRTRNQTQARLRRTPFCELAPAARRFENSWHQSRIIMALKLSNNCNSLSFGGLSTHPRAQVWIYPCMQKLNEVQIRAGPPAPTLKSPPNLAKGKHATTARLSVHLTASHGTFDHETGTEKHLQIDFYGIPHKVVIVIETPEPQVEKKVTCFRTSDASPLAEGFPLSCALHVQLAVAHAYLRGEETRFVCWLHVSCMYHQTE
jgi:hypothetical protein